MKWRQNLRLSTRSLLQAPLRTSLAVLTMAIGIAGAALLLGFGAGAEQALQQALEKMGRNLLTISSGTTSANALRGRGRRYETLTLEDYRVIGTMEGVACAAPMVMNAFNLRFDGDSLDTMVLGSTPEFLDVRRLSLAAGRFLEWDDVEGLERVAVVGAYVVEELFHGEWPLGKSLLINDAPYAIIGILEARGYSPEGADEDNRVLIPVTTAQRRLLNVDYVPEIFVQASSGEVMAQVQANLTQLLKERHHIAEGDGDDFQIRDQTRLLQAKRDAGDNFSGLVLTLSSLALFLGGIGILAVSMLSVRERYGEIGLRLAVGALPRDILVQFLSESLIIAVLAGLVGLAMGVGGIIAGNAFTNLNMALTWWSVACPFVISLVIAVIFGAWPAANAAKLNPIIALRSK